MNKKLVILTIIFGITAGIVLYVMPAAAQDIPPTECEEAIGRIMEVAGKYIAKEATAQQMIEDLQGIIKDKDAEIALLNKQVHHSMVKQ